MFDEFAKAITGANGTGDNIYRNYSAYKVNASPASVAGPKAGAQAGIDEQNRQNAAAEAKVAADADAQRKADEQDASKAQMIMKPDHSGYTFYDGTGKQLNINQFSLLTGKRPDEILADSDNPRDQQFVNDYKTMKAISNAWVNGDNATLQKYRAADPQKFNTIVSQYKTPGDMVKGFMSYYSDFYGDGNGSNRPAGQTFSPNNITAPSKQQTKQLGSTNLQQTLAPAPTAAPPKLGFLDTVNPFSGQRDALNRWKKQQASNPWYGYQSSLMGY